VFADQTRGGIEHKQICVTIHVEIKLYYIVVDTR